MNYPHLDEKIDIFDSIYYRVNKTFLSCIGQWPYQSKLASFFGNIVPIIFLSIFIPECLGLWKCWGDFDTMVECLSPAFVPFISLALIGTWTLKKKKMKILLEEMREDWKYWSLKPEISILHKYAMRGRLITIAYAICLYACATTFIILPAMPIILNWVVPLNESRPQKPLYIAEYFIDQEKYLYPILAQDFVCSILTTSILIIIETMFMVYTQHACGIFSLIGFKLKNLVNKAEHPEYYDAHKSILQKVVDEDIKFFIVKHSKVIKFVEDINDCFSTGFAIVMGANMLMISITGIQTVLKFGETREVIRYGSFTASQMTHLFFLCVPCENLIGHSLDVGKQVYYADWHKLPIKSQKLLLFIMRRSSHPSQLVAGAIFAISIQTYASILQTSMSYFTVLSSVR